MTRPEPAAFADFYTATFHRIAAQLNAYLGDHSEAQDLTQEAFCRAFGRWEKISRYENPGAWVRQVAWNLATSRLRHLQVVRRFVVGHRQEHAPEPGPERVDLTRALAKLPPNHRLAMVLHHVGHLSTSEIAEQQGVAEGTVRSWLSRGRAQLAEQLVDWGQAEAVAPPADGLATAVAKVRRRRTAKRAALAAALAVLAAIPVAILLAARPSEPPIITPTPVPSVSPSPASLFETRPVVVPGLPPDEEPEVRFVDAEHAWLWHNRLRILAVTADGGKSWRTITVPALPPGSGVVVYAYDARTVTLRVTHPGVDKPNNYWHTNDGGATFATYPVENPPKEAIITRGEGRYQMLCPGATGLEDGASGIVCDQVQLVKIGSGPVTRQPPVRTEGTLTIEGADGRIWLYNEESRHFYVSEDEARTWKPLPWPGESHGWPVIAPDGRRVWFFGDALWELVGAQWVKRYNIPAARQRPIIAPDGIVLAERIGAMSFFTDNGYLDVPGLPTGSGYVLRDGTIVLTASPAEIYLGTGSGTQRTWVRITM